MESCPLWRATAWKAKAAAPAAAPRSQKRLADEEGDEMPAAVRTGYPDAGRVLGHQVHRVRQGGGQTEDDRDRHVRAFVPSPPAEPCGRFCALEKRRPGAGRLVHDVRCSCRGDSSRQDGAPPRATHTCWSTSET